jgi:hypothetical protein
MKPVPGRGVTSHAEKLPEPANVASASQQDDVAIVEAELAALREARYLDLVERLVGKQEVLQRVRASGTCYSVELQALWDDKRLGNLRVIASIDDGAGARSRPSRLTSYVHRTNPS